MAHSFKKFYISNALDGTVYFKVKGKLQCLPKEFEKHFIKNFGKFILLEFLHYMHHGMINNKQSSKMSRNMFQFYKVK